MALALPPVPVQALAAAVWTLFSFSQHIFEVLAEVQV
jgi:hypothetical protein